MALPGKHTGLEVKGVRCTGLEISQCACTRLSQRTPVTARWICRELGLSDSVLLVYC